MTDKDFLNGLKMAALARPLAKDITPRALMMLKDMVEQGLDINDENTSEMLCACCIEVLNLNNMLNVAGILSKIEDSDDDDDDDDDKMESMSPDSANVFADALADMLKKQGTPLKDSNRDALANLLAHMGD